MASLGALSANSLSQEGARDTRSRSNVSSQSSVSSTSNAVTWACPHPICTANPVCQSIDVSSGNAFRHVQNHFRTCTPPGALNLADYIIPGWPFIWQLVHNALWCLKAAEDYPYTGHIVEVRGMKH